MPFIVQTIMVDEASFKVTASGARKAADSPVQCVLSSLLVKRDSQAVPELSNLHRPLQLMQNKPTNKTRRTDKNKQQAKRTTEQQSEQLEACSVHVGRTAIAAGCAIGWWPRAVATGCSGRSAGT